MARLIYFIFLDEIDNNPVSINTLNNIKILFSEYLQQIKNLEFVETGNKIFDEISININNYKHLEEFKQYENKEFVEFINNFKKYVIAIIKIINQLINYMQGKTKIEDNILYKINIKKNILYNI